MDISLLLTEEPLPKQSPTSGHESPFSGNRVPLNVLRPFDKLADLDGSTTSDLVSRKSRSHWSVAEDARIIRLRSKGLKWVDVSRQLPGRSVTSCRLHYQNYLEWRTMWDEDRNIHLARLYKRFKAQMWANIAEEMGIPWHEVEAAHWRLGEIEMTRRAKILPHPVVSTSARRRAISSPGPRVGVPFGHERKTLPYIGLAFGGTHPHLTSR